MLIDVMNDHGLEQLVHFSAREKNALEPDASDLAQGKYFNGYSDKHYLGLIFTSPVSSPKLLEIGTPLSLLLCLQRIRLLSLVLCKD